MACKTCKCDCTCDIVSVCQLMRQLEEAERVKLEAQKLADEAAANFGKLFIKYQQTCDAYNSLKLKLANPKGDKRVRGKKST